MGVYDPNWGKVDYASLIQSDPIYQMFKSAADASAASDAASRAASIGRLLGAYGQVPDLSGLGPTAGGYLGQDITDAVRGIANQNTQAGTSTVARLQHAHDLALAHIKAVLAARGTLQSGALGANVGQEEYNYKLGTFDARQQLLDAISSVISNYVAAEQKRQFDLAQAQQDAADRVQQQNPQTPMPDSWYTNANPADLVLGPNPVDPSSWSFGLKPAAPSTKKKKTTSYINRAPGASDRGYGV